MFYTRRLSLLYHLYSLRGSLHIGAKGWSACVEIKKTIVVVDRVIEIQLCANWDSSRVTLNQKAPSPAMCCELVTKMCFMRDLESSIGTFD